MSEDWRCILPSLKVPGELSSAWGHSRKHTFFSIISLQNQTETKSVFIMQNENYLKNISKDVLETWWFYGFTWGPVLGYSLSTVYMFTNKWIYEGQINQLKLKTWGGCGTNKLVVWWWMSSSLRKKRWLVRANQSEWLQTSMSGKLIPNRSWESCLSHTVALLWSLFIWKTNKYHCMMMDFPRAILRERAHWELNNYLFIYLFWSFVIFLLYI